MSEPTRVENVLVGVLFVVFVVAVVTQMVEGERERKAAEAAGWEYVVYAAGDGDANKWIVPSYQIDENGALVATDYYSTDDRRVTHDGLLVIGSYVVEWRRTER